MFFEKLHILPFLITSKIKLISLLTRQFIGSFLVLLSAIFQGTRKLLQLWFHALWYITSQKNGVSAMGLKQVLGLNRYETVWICLHKLRTAMVRPDRDCLSGIVEIDETYIGGKKTGKPSCCFAQEVACRNSSGGSLFISHRLLLR